MAKVLFVCKKRIDSYGQSFGLLNSAQFASEYLNTNDIEADVVSVTDANDIDRVVTQHNPTHVIIEAIWVPPAKFAELMKFKRHQDRHWVVRVHSKIPFIANEGIAFPWVLAYRNLELPNLTVAPNTPEFARDLTALGVPTTYLPNVYQPRLYTEVDIARNRADGELHIGCFGALRPMKNTLIQAVAAIRFAENHKQQLHFHINADRLEQRGDNVLRNLRGLFGSSHHVLVEHPWMAHPDFIRVIRRMDMGLQVSLTESFNIVTADFVSNGIPIVVSPDVDWMPSICQADPNSSDAIVKALGLSWGISQLVITTINKAYLAWYNRSARKVWLQYLN